MPDQERKGVWAGRDWKIGALIELELPFKAPAAACCMAMLPALLKGWGTSATVLGGCGLSAGMWAGSAVCRVVSAVASPGGAILLDHPLSATIVLLETGR